MASILPHQANTAKRTSCYQPHPALLTPTHRVGKYNKACTKRLQLHYKRKDRSIADSALLTSSHQQRTRSQHSPCHKHTEVRQYTVLTHTDTAPDDVKQFHTPSLHRSAELQSPSSPPNTASLLIHDSGTMNLSPSLAAPTPDLDLDDIPVLTALLPPRMYHPFSTNHAPIVPCNHCCRIVGFMKSWKMN